MVPQCDLVLKAKNDKDFKNQTDHVKSNHSYGDKSKYRCDVCMRRHRNLQALNEHFCKNVTPSGECEGDFFYVEWN